MSDKRIVIAGGTGMLGSACRELFEDKGYKVYVLSRSEDPDDPAVVQWKPSESWIAQNVVDGAHAVINLTGTPLDSGRWTDSFKKVLRDSRVLPAKFLGNLIRGADSQPAVYIGAAGIGIYGDSGASLITETYKADNQEHFVIQLSNEWEAAHPKVDDMRTVIYRIPPVLAMEGGFLPRVLEPAGLGAYGYFGDGSQWLPWIHIDDLARAVDWAIEYPTLEGTYNAVASALPLKELIRAIKSAKGGFGILAGLPLPIAKVAFGEMAEMLMWSCNPSSKKLLATGFKLKFPFVDGALEDLL
jgi:uncharacterized protein (TIGR01777 family)